MATPYYFLVVRLCKVATGLLSVLWQAVAVLICGHRSWLRLVPGCLRLRMTTRIPLDAIANVGEHGMRHGAAPGIVYRSCGSAWGRADGA